MAPYGTEAAICTYKNRDELEAIPRTTIISQRLSILQNKGNFNDTCKTSSHQGIAKHAMGHGTDHQRLRVSRHAPAGNEDDESWNKVALRIAVAISAQPDTGQAGTPPDDAHCSVLPIILDPGGAPAMFREGINAAPDGNNRAVVKFLRSASAADPGLSRKEDNSQDDAIGDKCATHDKMRGALADMVALAEAEGCNASKDHLHPGQKRHCFSNDRVEGSDKLANDAQDALLPVELQVQAQNHLADEQELQDVCKYRVHIVFDKLASLVRMSEKEADNSENGAQDLRWDVPS